ncbi:MAG: hypothetical protein ABI651_07700, partial [Verrucomicrobiota bacterium]
MKSIDSDTVFPAAWPARTFQTQSAVGTPRCGVPAPCRRGTGGSPGDGFVSLATECSAAERGGDGAARHPYLCLAALGKIGREICGLVLMIAWLVPMPFAYSAEPLRVAPASPVGKTAAPEKSLPSNPEVKSYLLLHQGMNQGYTSEEVDPEDIDAYFWHVFSRLPEEVTVYPSENYYYFVDCIRGMQIWGNIRLPAGRRERGILSFAYAEFVEFPTGSDPSLSRAKYFTEADALTIEEIDKFTYVVKFNRRSVRFRLHKISQEPPKLFSLRPDELFVERTFDESGIQFFLLFNTNRNYFSWV